MKKLLITGFDPFGGESVNPSWEAVKLLPEKIGAFQVTKLQIPTKYSVAAQTVLAVAEKLQPDVILCVGQAGGRDSITPEVVGINLREASIADNAGVLAQNEPVIEGAPAAYFATLPVRKMMAAVQAADIKCKLSYSAGAFVCNDTLYTLLHHFNGTQVQVGFVHVPFLPSQAKETVPSMPLETIADALKIAIEAI